AALGFERVGHVPALGPRGALALLVLEADLDGLVSVTVLGADLEDRARPELQDGDRGGGPLVVVDLRHPNLGSDQPERHGKPLANGAHRRAGTSRWERALA